MKKIIIIGASSGMGKRIACDFARLGWRVGIAARREEKLKEIKEMYPGTIEYITLDVAAEDAAERFNKLIELVGGMDYMLYASGCGWQNPELIKSMDEAALATNVVGFTRIINAAYKYYKTHPGTCRGHIAAITSVSGVKGIGISATYSASKRYQWAYLQAIDQLAHQQKVNVAITDIRPGFVDTALLNKRYPLEMSVDYIAPRIEKAILTAPRVKTIDYRWAIVCAFWRLIPNSLWNRIPLNI